MGGRDVPVIGLGTWDLERDPQAAAIAAVHRAIDLGMTHIDTAEMYGGGRVEELLGRALVGKRDQVFLASKVLPSNARRDDVLRACERSLMRMRTDWLDLYLLHWRGDAPLAETFRAFEELREAGKIRAWGVSNFDAADLTDALDLVGPGQIACNQVLYNLEERTVEYDVIPWCAEHDVAVVAYSPLGQGDFPAPGTKERTTLDDLGRDLGATAHQVALAYLTHHPSVLAIPKAGKPDHVDLDAAAGDLELSEDQVAAIEEAFPRGTWRGLPTT
jgi:diketogulonate reductase-like aldo/keto reductase